MVAPFAIGSGLSKLIFKEKFINSNSRITHTMTTVTSSSALNASTVSEIDPEIAAAIAAERQRQEEPRRAYRLRKLYLSSRNGSSGKRPHE